MTNAGPRLGFHVSIAGGLDKAVRNAVRRRCTAVQIFTGAPVQWARNAVRERDAREFAQRLADLDITPHFVHAKYLLNLSSARRSLWRRSVNDLAREVEAAGRLGAAGVITHLGSVGDGGDIADGIARIAEAVDVVCERVPSGPPIILENAAGQGNMVGAHFEDIAGIIDAADCGERLRVCIDTAHAFGAGHRIHTARGLTGALREMDASFGFDRLALLHLNDSLVPLASGRDRHWHIGHGEIGREAMGRIANHPRLRGLPFIMETPGTEQDDLSNMRRIRRLLKPANRPPLPPIPDWAK